ncbi:hypothetical protein SAMN04487943_10468 [Gracilibacillus orientalis]|uniref:DUF2157 domain-containing protein n=1 Tax=Gracilibacillus orientalis TaxID=334253 RepID=A0A1I4KNV4_9BACI|nr:hypothetical protein [Gracilibacillus orientalis]SFL80462.1 hypothetical protein SAMN04487943_10468 [Gracilibacillus orientalis]
MKDISKTEREKIVGQEMVTLLKEGYISEKEFTKVMKSYKQYKYHQEQLKEYKQSGEHMNSTPKQQTEQQQADKQQVKKEEVKQAKVKTAEQIRERNITWLLILGVSFLLISGLVVATSSWEQMGAVLKVVTLLGVSVFFLVLSGISSSFLKIEKTAFAFLTLGSLLLPIAIIAIGYFELFGSYLSLTGEGRYLLGVICTLLPLPLYARNAMKSQSRLFVWIFFLFMSFFVGFAIAATKVSVDVFYFLIMIYNAALLYGYHRYRNHKTFRIFIEEIPAYAQLNLVISTLLMLFVFDHALFYSFNVLLTAFLYIAMVFVYNTKSYQFVFSALFAYGAYQLTEHSWLQSIDLFIYGLIGVGYLVFAYLIKKDAYLAKVFHYTSGIISLFAFIYISYQGLVIRENQDSWILLLAYMTITCTYVYLSNMTERQVFRWLAPIFLYTCGLQFWDLSVQPFMNNSVQLFMFVFAGMLFIWIGIRNNYKYLQNIKKSTYYLSIAVMLLSMMYGLLVEIYMQVSFMFILFGCLALIVLASQPKAEKQVADWTHAISWLLAILVLYPELMEYFSAYHEKFNMSFHMAVSGLILLAISVVWKKVEKYALAQSAFYTGQFSYLMAVLLLMKVYSIEEMYVRPAILLVGIGVSVWLVRYARLDLLWSIVAVMTFAFYTSLLSTFSIETFESIVLFLLFAPVLLLVIERFAGAYVKALKVYFFWLAHIVQLSVLMLVILDQLLGQSVNPIVSCIPFLIYLYSTVTKTKEWQIRLFLYLALTMVPFLLITNIAYYDLLEYIPFTYCLIASTIMLVIVWFVVNPVWKRRMEWYLIPFANFSLLIVVTVQQMSTLLDLVIVGCFIILNLYLLHKRKWSMVAVLPLTLSILMWEQQRFVTEDIPLLFIYIGCFLSLLITGRFLYNLLFHKDSQKLLIDWYSVVAVMYVGYTLNFIGVSDTIWIRIIPYLLLTLWLFLQVNRIDQPFIQKIFITLGALSFLPSYYLVLQEYLAYISELFHAELVVLPVLALSIVMARRTWSNYQSIMTHVQSVILVLITVYLVVDAIQSNTVWDALIVGILSLVALLTGMKFQIKSYFFVGLGTLLFNVIYQTKPYWGNMPWWGYLLIAGITLITIASYNEWKKQRQTEGKLEKKVKTMISRFKEWK